MAGSVAAPAAPWACSHPVPPAPPPMAPRALSPLDPGPGTPILTAVLRTHDYLVSHRAVPGMPTKTHLYSTCHSKGETEEGKLRKKTLLK